MRFSICIQIFFTDTLVCFKNAIYNFFQSIGIFFYIFSFCFFDNIINTSCCYKFDFLTSFR